MTGYDFHPEAESDIDAIWEFIAKDNPDAADRVIDKIVSAIEAVVPFPDQGHRRPDLTSRQLRFTTAANYLIAYAPDKKPLWIIAIMQGRRSPARHGRDLERQGVSFTMGRLRNRFTTNRWSARRHRGLFLPDRLLYQSSTPRPPTGASPQLDGNRV